MTHEVPGVLLSLNCKFFTTRNKYMFLSFYAKTLTLSWKLENISTALLPSWAAFSLATSPKKCLTFIFCDSKCSCLGKLRTEKKVILLCRMLNDFSEGAVYMQVITGSSWNLFSVHVSILKHHTSCSAHNITQNSLRIRAHASR